MNLPASDALAHRPDTTGDSLPSGLMSALSMLPGVDFEFVATVDSTNAQLMRRARAGCLTPTLLVAGHQTAGRGRRGHTWQDANDPSDDLADPRMAALVFSLGLPLGAPPRASGLSGLSLAAGLSLATSLHPDLLVKWPNDLWWQGRKLGGVLIETTCSGRYAVVGVGLNILKPDHAAARDFATAPAGLVELWPNATALQALARVAAPLWRTVNTFLQCGFAPLQAAFQARDALRDTAVILDNGLHGVARGVDATGAWQVQTADGLVCVTSLALSVRPVDALLPCGGADWLVRDPEVLGCCG